MEFRFASGDRVRVSDSFLWAKGANGKVSPPPDEITRATGPWDGNLTREEISEFGANTVYWVWFDQPQFVAEDDGPYIGGCIWESALSKI